MSLVLCDVGPRDGLQNDPTILPPKIRSELAGRIAAAGLPRIEVASFVRPARVPAMAGAETVAELTEGLRSERAALVLNETGFERFSRTTLKRVHVAVSASESHSLRNQNCTVEQALAAACQIRDLAHERGIAVTAYVMVAFGCPFEGDVDPGRVVELATQLCGQASVDLVLADTIGVAVPRQVKQLLAVTADLGARSGVHLHNTRNTGYANAYAAVEAGATLLDASLGGIGGCPFAPGATGNIATEDLVFLLEREGVTTGIDLDALISAARWLEPLLGHQLEGQLYRVGAGVPTAAAAPGS